MGGGWGGGRCERAAWRGARWVAKGSVCTHRLSSARAFTVCTHLLDDGVLLLLVLVALQHVVHRVIHHLLRRGEEGHGAARAAGGKGSGRA
jgi:hypothetical protein